jgi:hypothetical protein
MDEFAHIELEVQTQILIDLAHAKAKRERFDKLAQHVKLLPYDEQVKLFQVLVEELGGS